MGIPTRKSLWEQILDILKNVSNAPSQAVNPSDIQTRAQTNQKLTSYVNPLTQQSIQVNTQAINPSETTGIQEPFQPKANFNLANLYGSVIEKIPSPIRKTISTTQSIINPIGQASFIRGNLNVSDEIQRKVEELYQQAMKTTDKQKRNELLRQSISLSQRGSQLSRTALNELPSLANLPKITSFGTVNLLPQFKEVNEQISKNIVEEYRKKYPQYEVPTDIPIKEQEKMFSELIRKEAEQKVKPTISPEEYKEPTSLFGQFYEGVKSFYHQTLKPNLSYYAKSLARDLNLPSLYSKLDEVSARVDAYAQSRWDLNPPKELQDLSGLTDAIKKDPVKYVPMALGRFFGNALPYTLTTVATALIAKAPNVSLLPIYAVEKGGFQKELLQKGYDPDIANAVSGVYGLMSAAIEVQPFGGYTPAGLAKWLEQTTTKGLMKTGWKSFLIKAPKSLVKLIYNSFWEGNEEVLQEGLKTLFGRWLKDPEAQKNVIPQLFYSWLGGFTGSLPLGVTQFSSNPPTRAGLSIEEIGPSQENVSPETSALPPEVKNLINKQDELGATIVNITPIENGYQAIIRTPNGNEFPTIINNSNLDYFIGEYYIEPTSKKIENKLPSEVENTRKNIISQIAKLNRQLEETTDNTEAAAIQTKIDKLQAQLDKLESSTTPEVQPETKPETKPEVKPEIQTKVPTEIIPETPPEIPPETPPQEPIKETTEQPPQKIVRTSEKLGGNYPYTPISTKERLDRVKDYLTNNREIALDALNKGELPSNLPADISPAEIAAYAFQSDDPKLIEAVRNNSPIMDTIHKSALDLQILGSAEQSRFITNLGQAAKEITNKQNENLKKITSTDNLTDAYNKVDEAIKEATNEVIKVRDNVIKLQLPSLKNVLDREGITIDNFLSMSNEERMNFLVKYFGADAYKIKQSFDNLFSRPQTYIKGITQSFESWAKRKKIPLSVEATEKFKAELEKQKANILLTNNFRSALNIAVKKGFGITIEEKDLEKINQYLPTIQETLDNSFDYEKGTWKEGSEEAQMKFAQAYYDLQTEIQKISNPINPLVQIIAEMRESGKKSLLSATKSSIKNLNDIIMFFKANLDRSLLGRQMRPLLLTHPKEWLEVAKINIKSFKEDPEAIYASVYMNLYRDPNFIMGRMNNLIPTTFEEMPAVKFFEEISKRKGGVALRPFIKSSAAFEAGYIEGLRLFADGIYRIKEIQGVDINNPEVIKDVQNYTKTFLMQAPLGRSEFWQSYKAIAWAAGLTKSSFQHIGYLFGAAPKNVRDVAMKEEWKLLLSSLAIILLMHFVARKPIEKDPRKASFLSAYLSKSKDIYVNLYPFSSEVVLMTRMGLHLYNLLSPSGGVNNYVSVLTNKEYNTATGGGFNRTMLDVLLDFIEGKSKPLVGLVIDFLKNETYGGQPFSASTVAKEGIVPISIGNFWDAWRNTEEGRKYYATIAAIADYFGIKGTSFVRTLRWNYDFTKEVSRLSEAGYSDLQTLYHLGFMPYKKGLSTKENEEIINFIVDVVNTQGIPLIKSAEYQNLTDAQKAKVLAKNLDKTREIAYQKFLINHLTNASTRDLENLVLRYNKAGLLTPSRWNKIYPKLPQERRYEVYDIIKRKLSKK